MHPLARYLDPRRSLASAIGWLVFALSIGLVLVASVWVGDIVRTNLLDQRDRQLDRTADRIAAELNLNIALRLQSVRALAAMLATELRDENQATLRKILENLQQASPEFAWIGVANPQGRVLAATHGVVEGASVADQSWFALGLNGSRVGDVRLAPMPTKTPPAATDGAPRPVAHLVASVIDSKGDNVGVIGAQLGARWLEDLASGLGREQRGSAGTEALLLDENGTVLIGPAIRKGQRWESTPESTDAATPIVADNVPSGSVEWPSRVERLADGSRYLVAHAKPAASDALHTLGWRVVVLQPLRDATQGAQSPAESDRCRPGRPGIARRVARRAAGTPRRTRPGSHRTLGRCRPSRGNAKHHRSSRPERSGTVGTCAGRVAHFAAARTQRIADPECRTGSARGGTDP